MIVLNPRARNVRIARTAHQSNSTDEPIRYTPEPRTMTPWSSNVTSDSIAL